MKTDSVPMAKNKTKESKNLNAFYMWMIFSKSRVEGFLYLI
jgi:hypothetical protein